MSYKAISHVFEEYRKARAAFAYDVCEFATWQSSTKYLEGTDVIELLAPLISEKITKIRRRAITAAGRLAEKSEVLARKMMASKQFSSLLKHVYNSDISTRKTIIYFIKAVARHDFQIASELVKLGALPDLVISLEDFDIEVKRDAVCALGNIGKHNATLAKTVIESGALQLLISCFLQPDVCLQQNVVKVFEDLAQYHPEDIMTVGALPHIVKAVENTDLKIKISALKVLAMIVDISEDLANLVVESGALKIIMNTPYVPSAFIIRNMVKHTPQLAQKAVESGACGLLVQLLALKETVLLSTTSSTTALSDSNQTKLSTSQLSVRKNNSIDQGSIINDVLRKRSCMSLISKATQHNTKYVLAPVVEALGFIAAHSPKLALDVISARAIVPLVKILCDSVRMSKGHSASLWDNNEQLCTVCSAVWALGQISQHSSEHSESVAAAGTLPLLVQLWQNNEGSEEILKQVEYSFSLCLKHCLYRPALEPLLHLAPSSMLKPVLVQYSKILPHDAKARRLFVTTGALQKVQELSKDLDPDMESLIRNINACFPDEILKYCSPDFVNTLLEHVDKYTPQIQNLPDSN